MAIQLPYQHSQHSQRKCSKTWKKHYFIWRLDWETFKVAVTIDSIYLLNLRWHHRESGDLSSTLLRMETKWFLNVWIARSAILQWWQSGGTNLWVIPLSVMHSLNFAKHSLSNWWCFNQVPRASSCWPFFGRQWSFLPWFYFSLIHRRYNLHPDGCPPWCTNSLVARYLETRRFGLYELWLTICTSGWRCCSDFWWSAEVGSLCLDLFWSLPVL